MGFGIDWSILIVSSVRSENDASVVEGETSRCSRLSGMQCIRTEIMRATPASYHPAPAQRARRNDLAFVVELIAAHADAAALDEYRETMRTSIGPAVGLLVRDNQFYCEELNPERGDFRKVFARLDAIRAKPRGDVAEEIVSLSP